MVDSVTDRAGRTTSFTYDAVKWLTDVQNPETGVTSYRYDPNGNLTGFTDPESHTTSFAYDLDNRLIRKTYHDSRFVRWAYNAVGLVQTFTNARNIVTTYSYDATYNLDFIDYGDATPDVDYGYDEYDRLTQMIDGIGAWNFGYNLNSQLTSVDGPWNNDTISYVPDDLGRISQVSPQGGAAVSYVYDTLNRLRQIQRGAESFVYSYDGVNPLVQRLRRPNGSVTEYAYDNLNRLLEIVNTTDGGEILSQHRYTYNKIDLRDTEWLTGPAIPPMPALPEQSTDYAYNDVNQLLSTVTPDQLFDYDDDGNMTKGYTPEGYQFTAAYDAENRMLWLQYTDGSGTVHRKEFQYSGDDLVAVERLYQNGSLITETRFVCDGMLAVQERNAGNSVISEYTWGLNLGGGIGGLLNLNQGGQDYAYLYDGKGNVEAVLDASQSVVAAYRYDPFGVLLNKTGSLTQPYGFSTKRYDEQIGMIQYEYRNYFPSIGRWGTRDPLGEAGGMNLYAFVGNNPVNWIDPWGLQVLDLSNLIGRRKQIRERLGFVPTWLLDIFMPITPNEIGNEIAGTAMGMVCVVYSGSNAANKIPKLWKITEEGTDQVMYHGRFGKFYRSIVDELWWSKDLDGHGGSVWKVFKETAKGLEWIADADEFGNFIVNKFKSDVGKSIPWKQLNKTKF